MKEIRTIDSYVSERKKEEKRKKNKKHRNFKPQNVKNPENIFRKPKKLIKKYGESKYEDFMFNSLHSLSKYLEKLFNGKEGKVDFEDITDAFSNKKVAKAFINACEDYLDNDIKLPEVYSFLISEMYLSKSEVTQTKEFRKMLKLFKRINKDKISEMEDILKKIGVAKKERSNSALYFVLISSSYKGFKRQKTRINRYFKAIYRSFNDGEEIKAKLIKKMIFTCFGKHRMGYVSSVLLKDKRTYVDQLSTKEEKEVYSIVTTIALDYINKLDRDDLKSLLKNYAKGREGRLNQKLRVNFFTLDDGDYKHIAKMVDRLTSNGIRREAFE